MPESPRWLMTQGQYERAEKIMITAAKRNNITVQNMPAAMKQLKERIEKVSIFPLLFLVLSQNVNCLVFINI